MKKIKLTQGKYVTVDDADYELVSKYTWCASKRRNGGWYAVANLPPKNGKHVMIYMHRLILSLKTGDGKITDHINRNGLNNRRCNLRIVSMSENNRNKKGYGKSKQRGVSWSEREKRWKVRVTIGSFGTEVEAVQAFKTACRILGLI